MRFEDLIEFDDMWMIQAAQNLHLPLDTPHLLYFQLSLLVDLDCDFTLGLPVDSALDQRVCTPT